MFKYGVVILPMALAPLAFGQSAATAQHSRTAASETDGGVQRAIAFERLKSQEDAVQARKEQRHPSNYNYQADRQAGNRSTVKDPGPAQYQRDKIKR